jgi:D-alanyl-D-alanine carboxypeptidase (penicillin-binding protein 5/6)
MMISFIPSVGANAEGFTYDFESHCKSIYMFNLDDGEALYEKDPDLKLPMASLTKIMTFIVAYENIPNIETTVITVSSEVETQLSGTGSSMSGVIVGEELTGLQLLNLMLIPSGNDAALTLAIYVDDLATQKKLQCQSGEDGTVDNTQGDSSSAFVNLMNAKAKELGCVDTHFVNPHGLYDENHYTTARDMGIITKYATTLPYFTDITSSSSYTLPKTNKSDEERTVYTTNKMMSQYADDSDYYYAYVTGIKTGSLDEAGYCIVASATYQGYTYVVVALGSPMIDSDGNSIDTHGEMLDAKTLFRWAFTHLEYKTIVAKGDLVGDISLKYAWDKDKLQLVAEKNVSAILPSDISVSSIVVSLDIPDSIQAPVKKGDLVGTATFSYADQVIATVNIVASESISRSDIVQTIETGKDIITSKWFLIILTIILLILFVYLIIIIIYNRKKKKLRRVKKYRDL